MNSKIFLNIKEAPKIMTIPILILSVGAIFSGIYFYDIVKYSAFWQDSLYFEDKINFVKQAHQIPTFFKALPVIFALLFSILVILYLSIFSKFIN